MAEPTNFISDLLGKFKFKILLLIYFYTLFKGSVNNWNHIWLDETEWWLEKDLEGIGYTLIQGSTLESAWRE